uniref:Fatty acid hydroxylase domain-containing protein n=1 Tax=Rhabditophanes sp. KR3021 TaxID=114890 RepID=A0AC35U9C5_9BILA
MNPANLTNDLLSIVNETLLGNSTEKPWLDKIFTNTSFGHRLLERLTFTNFRHSLYLISPYESAVGTVEEVPNYNIEVAAWWTTLIFIEFIILYFQHHEDRFALNDSIVSISAGMLSQCFKFGGRALAIFAYVFVWNNCRVLELPWESPWTWILCLFTQDFMYYLGHRAVHEAGFFWGLHSIHHSSEYYNFSTALRQAAIQDAGLAFYDVLQAFFIPPPIFLVHRYFSEIFQFWMHTSLLGTLGPLGIIFNTPSYHRVHHGRNPYCIDKNYGGVFIIWDKMFHTFEPEREDDLPVYGLVKNEDTFNQLYLQFHTIFDMLWFKGQMKNEKDEQIFPGIINKIKAALFPPGYFPGTQVVLFFHWYSMKNPSENVPEIQKPVTKYNPQIPSWLKLYCLSHFVLLLCIFMHFDYDRLTLSYHDFILRLAYFVVSFQMFGAFFDNVWYANFIEIFRCTGVLIYYVFKILDPIGPNSSRIFIMTVFGISLLMWIGYSFEQCKDRMIKKKENSARTTFSITGKCVVFDIDQNGWSGKQKQVTPQFKSEIAWNDDAELPLEIKLEATKEINQDQNELQGNNSISIKVDNMEDDYPDEPSPPSKK